MGPGPARNLRFAARFRQNGRERRILGILAWEFPRQPGRGTGGLSPCPPLANPSRFSANAFVALRRSSWPFVDPFHPNLDQPISQAYNQTRSRRNS